MKMRNRANDTCGLGKIGGNVLRRLMKAGHHCFVDGTSAARCSRGCVSITLRPLVVAALDRAAVPPADNKAAQVRSTQQKLAQLGCYSGPVDGALNDATHAAIAHYEKVAASRPAMSPSMTTSYPN